MLSSKAMETKNSPKTRIYYYEINEEGELLFEGKPLLDEKTISFFFKHLKPVVHLENKMENTLPSTSEKAPPQYIVLCQGEKNFITCFDAPLVTTSIRIEKDPKNILLSVTLLFRGSVKDDLDPKTLFIGDNNILYFKAMNGQIPGRFSRKCYMEITQFIFEKEGGYFIEINQKTYPISSKAP